ncbi:hypothetical protein Pint_23485 [Pistacia integerrima]|uniref:Uncharacterized protein n=1 Tax=Pistacia integerrima TaxID=434235 RepID=A0ACC0YNV4_9ROSI|nr:hypothetical protein Pint_23485 [Pistacia integerrima]
MGTCILSNDKLETSRYVGLGWAGLSPFDMVQHHNPDDTESVSKYSLAIKSNEMGMEKDIEKDKEKEKDEEQEGMSVHSPCKAPPSSASSLPKEQSQVELELRLLEALEIYPPVKLRGRAPVMAKGTIISIKGRLHLAVDAQKFLSSRYASPLCPLWSNGIPAKEVVVFMFVFPFLIARFDRHFSPDEVLQLMDRFYNLEMLKPDDEEMEILNHEEDFNLPQSYFDKEE